MPIGKKSTGQKLIGHKSMGQLLKSQFLKRGFQLIKRPTSFAELVFDQLTQHQDGDQIFFLSPATSRARWFESDQLLLCFFLLLSSRGSVTSSSSLVEVRLFDHSATGLRCCDAVMLKVKNCNCGRGKNLHNVSK